MKSESMALYQIEQFVMLDMWFPRTPITNYEAPFQYLRETVEDVFLKTTTSLKTLHNIISKFVFKYSERLKLRYKFIEGIHEDRIFEILKIPLNIPKCVLAYICVTTKTIFLFINKATNYCFTRS
jgi:hypothetical protein